MLSFFAKHYMFLMSLMRGTGKGGEKATQCLSKEDENDIECFPSPGCLWLCHEGSVFNHKELFKSSSHTSLRVQVSDLELPGHTNLLLRLALPEKWETLSQHRSCGKLYA